MLSSVEELEEFSLTMWPVLVMRPTSQAVLLTLIPETALTPVMLESPANLNVSSKALNLL